MQTNKKRHGYLISAILLLTLFLITLFTLFLFMHPTVYFSKSSGFSQHDGVKAGKNKLRFVVPETIDVTKSTFISVKQEWFETSRMGKITDIKAKPNKYLALDFSDREYNSEVFTIYTKNWFGIKREHDVIVDYSNFLRVFFPEPNDGQAPSKSIILPYSKLKTEYKHIYEELLKIKSFIPFNEKGLTTGQTVNKEEVFVKENARGRAFLVNNDTHLSLVYDFLLPGIFKNQAQKTQVFDYIEKSVGKFTAYNPAKQGINIKFNTAPFYISKFLGWYYIDPTGNRVDLKPGEEVQIPKWVKSELRLIARYDITTDTDKMGPELDKQGLVAVSYFDGAQRVIFDIVKKGTPLKEHIYQKEGYAYAGWYKDSALTKKVDFTKELANTHTVLYLKSIKQNQPQPEKPVKYHTVNFITPSGANQLFSTKRAHGQKLESNYLIPSLVSRLDEHGNLWELDHWNLVDPITGTRTRFNFNTAITEDITLEAVMRKRIPPTSKYTIKRYYESVDQAGNFIEDKSKEEVVENQTTGQEVQLSPTQTNAPTGFKLADGTITNKKINKDGTTVFELKYTRNRYKVNFEVNYNGNHFKDVNSSSTPEQTVPYEGKLTRPANPAITKPGYTYTFKHWQLKDEMGNVYKEVSEFDFNTKITKNLTLVAYFEEKKDTAVYTVKHIFQGILNQIDERIEERKFTEQVGKSVTVTKENRDKSYDEHFEVADFSETKKVEADGSTVFEIRYARKKYKVNFEVNYQNHFAGANESSEPTQTISYQGKVKKPEFAPSLANAGRTYTFKHWQLKDEMGNFYKEVSAFDFDNSQITKNITLVAYFEETINNVTYKVVHYLEKTGKDSILNDQYERIEEIKTDQKVEDGATYQEYLGLDHQLYEKHTSHPGNKLNAQLNAGDNSVEVCQYYKLKEVEVKFKKTDGIATFSYETLKVKKTRSVVLPTYTLKNTHNFAGWALSANGETQNEFVVDKATTNLEIYAKTDYMDREIIYTIKKENADGSFNVSHEKKTAKIASNHTAFYANPDSSIYKEPEVSPKNLTINADNNQNKVTVNILRRTQQVTFEVKGHSSSIAARTIKHGAKIGTIDESEFVKDGLSIRKIELDGKEATKIEIENHVVYKSHKVTIYISKLTRKIGKYPQTLVNNPKGIQLLGNELHEIKFNSKSKDYSLNFTRSYWKDNEGNKYEKYNGKYFKFEDVYFVKMPKQNTWFTEKIIDYSQLNIFYWDAPENAKIERTMFKSLVLDIGKVIGETVYMPNYNDNDEFSVKPAIQEQMYSELQKKSTDYAKEVMGDYNGSYISFYRGTNLSQYVESGVHMPFHHNAHYNCWTLGTQINNSAPGAFYVYKNGYVYDSYLSNRVLGVVVCVK